MQCNFKYCIFNKNGTRCRYDRATVTINEFGMCNERVIVDFEKEVLDAAKLKAAEKYVSELTIG